MIANPNYQLLVTENDLVVCTQSSSKTVLDSSFASIKGSNRGKILIVDENDIDNVTISSMTRFSLYQYALNDKGKEILIKHGGALPIDKDRLRKRIYNKYAAGVSQYWKLTLDSDDFTPCCENYSIRFGMYNDAIQKTMFPSELVETYSVENECCGRGCGNNSAYSAAEVAFRLWADVATHNMEAQGYVSAWILDGYGKVIADSRGVINNNSYSSNIKDVRDGMIKYTYSGNTYVKSVSEFVTLLNISDPSVVFGIASEPENTAEYHMNFKYDVIRNTCARVTLNGGFECAEGVTLIWNNDSTNGTAITTANAYAASGVPVGQFAYSIGSGYDIREMELGDSLHTLNSPYTLSDVTLSENGIHFRAKTSDTYDVLNLEYQQPSDGVTRVEHHPWGTTIAIKHTTSNLSNWTALLNILSGRSDAAYNSVPNFDI